jgi:hypothetical protein
LEAQAPQPTPPLWPARAARILLAAVLILAAADCLRILHDGFTHVLRPYPTCDTELHIVDGIRSLARGEFVYPEVGGLPFLIRVYNPMTYVPAGLVGRLFPDDFEALLIAGRVLPYLSALLFLLLVARYTHHRFGSWLLTGFAPVLMLIMHSSTLTDFFRNRPEMPALALTFAGWYAFELRIRAWPVLSALLFVAAFAFKQSIISAPVAVLLLLAHAREGRSLVLFVTTSVLAGSTLALGAYLFLGSGYFNHTLALLAVNPVDPLRASSFFYPILVQRHWGAFFPASLLAVSWLLFRGRAKPLCTYLAVCLLWTTYSHGKTGADLNYHGELSILMALAVVVATGTMIQMRSRWAPLPVAGVVLFLVWGIASHGYGWNRVCLNRIRPTPHCSVSSPPFGDVRAAAEAYRSRSDDALILQSEIALRTGRPVAVGAGFITLLFRLGALDLEPLFAEVRSRRPAIIVLPRRPIGLQSRVAREALAAGYAVVRSDDHVLELERR